MLFLLRDFRLMALLPIARGGVIASAPAQVTDRIYSMFDLNDPTSRDRVAMLEAGVAIVKDHPLTGVGPDMVGRVYPDYRVADGAVQEHNLHLHNVPMQIAAERGLPALAMWLWFVVIGAASACCALLDRIAAPGARRHGDRRDRRRCSRPACSSTTSAIPSS